MSGNLSTELYPFSWNDCLGDFEKMVGNTVTVRNDKQEGHYWQLKLLSRKENGEAKSKRLVSEAVAGTFTMYTSNKHH